MVAFKILGENVSVFGDERFSRKVRFVGYPNQIQEAQLEEAMTHRFRCKDDDGVTYFWGVCSDCDSEEAFAPLDCVGYDYGCESIEYKNENGEYEEL